MPASRIARWDGTSWHRLPAGGVNGNVLSLTLCDDGGGPALYAGGEFTTAGGLITPHVARWRGSSWSTLGSGASDPVDVVLGTPRGLYVGGRMSVSPAGDSFLANRGARRRVHREE